MDDTTRMPFDQYQRYRLVADVLENVRPKGEALEVLDVGGRTALLRRFLPNDEVELVDLEESEETGLVIGSGAQLPFKDGAFDAVVCFDTLEHVPPALRDAFAAECARVARRWVVIAGPYHTAQVERAEELLQQFLGEKLGEKHRYLEEHRDLGLPDRKQTEACLRAAGARVRSIGHANLERWLPLMCVSLYMDRDAALRGMAEGFHEFYNEALYASDHAKPVYRHAVVAAFGKAALPKADELLGPSVAPKGSLKPFDHMVQELLAFDSQRDVVKAEWDRLETVHRGLEADLAGHKASIDGLRDDLAVRDEVIAQKDAGLQKLESGIKSARTAAGDEAETLRADLAEHDKTIDTLRAELETRDAGVSALEQELTRERTAGVAEREQLGVDLEQHRASLAELTRLRGELQGVVKQLEVVVTDKDAAIASVHEELERERTESGRTIEILTRDLDAHKKHAAALEAERDDFAKEVSRLLAMLLDERRQHAEREGAGEQGELEERQRSEASALEEDLGKHHQVLTRLREELEGSMASRERREERLRREIQQHGAAVAALTTHLQEAQQSLEGERVEIQALREELHSRWRSLLRVLSPKREED